MRVMVAIDASEASRKVIDYLAAHHAMFRTAQITCVYIDTPPPLRAVGAFGADPGMPALPPGDPEALADKLIAPLRAAGYEIDVDVREGEPGPEITQMATDGGYDLIVMGAGERGLLRRKLLGSVAHTVLSHSTTPILIVR
jgi:nucleotide-binding universal stress UspA family protein